MYYVKGLVEALAAGLTAAVGIGWLRKPRAPKAPKPDDIPEL